MSEGEIENSRFLETEKYKDNIACCYIFSVFVCGSDVVAKRMYSAVKLQHF